MANTRPRLTVSWSCKVRLLACKDSRVSWVLTRKGKAMAAVLFKGAGKFKAKPRKSLLINSSVCPRRKPSATS
jgi:hypothetical protein